MVTKKPETAWKNPNRHRIRQRGVSEKFRIILISIQNLRYVFPIQRLINDMKRSNFLTQYRLH